MFNKLPIVRPIEQTDLNNIDIKVVNQLQERAGVLEDFIVKIGELEKKEDRDRAINKNAIIATVNQLSGFAVDYVKKCALEAVLQTVEFNYKGYYTQLLSAIDAEAQIYLRCDENANIPVPEITVDLTPLGGLDEWLNAVKSVRGEREDGGVLKGRAVGPGASKYARAPNKEVGVAGDDLASRIWREKYYKAGREGHHVYRMRKIRISKQERADFQREHVGEIQESQYTEGRDVTAKYKQAYATTMQNRLAILKGSAPYWYLINFGNPPVGHEATSPVYPTYPATNFVTKATELIQAAFDQAILINVEKAKKIYEDIFGIYTKGTKSKYEEAGVEAAENIYEIKEWLQNAHTYEVRQQIEIDNNTYREVKSPKGKLFAQFDLGALSHKRAMERKGL